ncbi:MAG TPA: Atu1372/SO_1960 family protein, partial [Sphingomicrobium sp.]
MTAPPEPVGLYEPFTRCGELVFLSAISSARDGTMITGKVGANLSLEEGREAARRAAANLLAVLSIAAEDEVNIRGILLLRGQVNAADD